MALKELFWLGVLGMVAYGIGRRTLVLKAQWFNFFGMGGWFFQGRILKRKELPEMSALLFDRFIPFFERIERYLTLPVGMSLIIIGEKSSHR